MKYRCVTTSVEGFVQQLAVAYITHGYWFYVVGEIPEGKDPVAIDAKLIERYGIAISKWARCRRKKQGLANMQYLRHERFFVLLATKGTHEFFERERTSFRDVRRKSIMFAGYNIGCHKGRDGCWHPSVRIDIQRALELRARFNDVALWRSPDKITAELNKMDLLQYAPVRRQLQNELRAINCTRKRASMPAISKSALLCRRRIARPFLMARPASSIAPSASRKM